MPCDPGTSFSGIPDVIIIYITTFDVFHKGCIKYRVTRKLDIFNEEIDDGEQIFYINSAIDDGSDLAKLMKVFLGDKEFLGLFKKCGERIHQFTETEKGWDNMDNLLKEWFGDDIEKEKKEERLKEKKEIAINMLSLGFDNETIVKCTGLSIDVVKSLVVS